MAVIRQRAAHRGCLLAHTLQSKSRNLEVFRVKTLPIIMDFQLNGLCSVSQADPNLGSPAVASDIGQRLLGDAVNRLLGSER